ncbi:MAG TPA: diacylglycerol kinase [Rhizobiaceae bacterium]|nr:diacylglycerol kinase [Rhizobiaceae bacterium]
MERLIKAFQNSVRAFRRLIRTEKAFQQEIGLLLVALPVAWFLAESWRGFALLIGSLLFLIVVEVLNTGIEAACDAVSREFNIDIQLAKDCGSLAVLISIVLVLGVWAIAIAERLFGLPV